MRVLIIGDVHGQHRQLADRLRQVQTDYRVEAAVQVGDFGFDETTLAESVRFPMPLYVVDGNHEDHRWLRQQLQRGVAERWRQEWNLVYQPRGSVARLGGSTVGFLGGALHVDRPQQHNLLSRSPNYILRHQREAAIQMFNRARPDLIVTHSCPAGIGVGLRGWAEMAALVAQHITGEGFDPGPAEDCGDLELTGLWRGLTYRPRAWVFGHFHAAHEATVEGTQFRCIGHDWGQTLVLWDTEERRLLSVPTDPSA